MGSCGGGDSQTSSRFSRKGTSKSTDLRTIPDFLTNLLRNNAEKGDISSTLGSVQNTFLEQLLQRDHANMPGKSTLDNAMAINPTTFQGSTALGSVASTNPYSSGYTSELDGFYDNLFKEVSAIAKTGPEAVRGGTSHGAMVEANLLEKAALDKFREVTQLQLAQADRTNAAASAFSNIENNRRGTQLLAQNNQVQQLLQGLGIGVAGSNTVNQRRATNIGALESMAGQLGRRESTVSDDLTGSGFQDSSHHGWQAGLNCCFIFLEALNGELPWYVRRGRDLLGDEDSRRGYVWMSQWLVPRMRTSALARKLTNVLIVKPFLVRGAYFFNAEGSRPILGRLVKPLCRAWMQVWRLIGRRVK